MIAKCVWVGLQKNKEPFHIDIVKEMMNLVYEYKIKKVISVILFLGIAFEGYLHFSYLFRNTGWSRYNITMFYEEPKDSLDVVFIGASNVFRYFNPLQAYSQQGFTSYDYAVEFGMPLLADAIKDIERTQDPKLFVIDPRYFVSSCWSSAISVGCKNQLGSQDFHILTRIEAVIKYKFLGGKGFRDALSIYCDLPVYHDNKEALGDRAHWIFSDDNRGDAGLSSYGSAKGYVLFSDIYKHSSFSDSPTEIMTKDTEPLETSAERLYRDFLLYCARNQIPVLLVESPFLLSGRDVLQSNILLKIAGEYGIPFLDWNFILQESKLSYETDFSDASHVNILGAEKYTDFLARYISEHYSLPDHRGDNAFSSWDVDWNKFKKEQTPLIEQLARDVSKQND